MNGSEKYLLLAVRNQLRTGGKYSDQQCEVEFDEMAPATIGDVYLAVMPGGCRQGPRHNTQSGVYDLVYGVDVTVIKRTRHVPRDRLRDVFLNNIGALDDEIDNVVQQVDWSYVINAAANALIVSAVGSQEGFIEPLRFQGMDRRPRIAPSELFSGQGESAGMMRTVNFGGARRVTHR